MASCQTSRWVSTSPYVVLTVTETSSTATTATLSYTLQYKSDYAANTNGNGRDYTITIGGATVKTGAYNIDGKTGTKTICTGTHTINKTTSAQTISFGISFAFNITWSGTYGGTKTASSSISVSAKTKYTVSYNANGGSDAPAAQTKWHGTALTLSTTKPTRTGYSFQGWATSSSGSVAYAAGASYTANAGVTLYAVWKANTYKVSYNANGGSGAPAAQTKTYGVTLTLSSAKPTRANYTFLGWSTSASATTATYAAGGSYTSNAAATLYAVWKLAYVKPSVTNVVVYRAKDALLLDDAGSNIWIEFNWSTFHDVSSVNIQITSSAGDVITDNPTVSGKSGSYMNLLGGGSISTDYTYTVKITVTDSGGSTPITRTVAGTKFAIDFMEGGNGAAVGKPAEDAGVFDIAFQTRHIGGLLPILLPAETNLDDVRIPNTYIGENVASNNYVNCPLTAGTFSLTVTSGGTNGQVRQVLTQCNKTAPMEYERWYYTSAWGGWMLTRYGDNKILWGGDMTSGMYMTEGHTANLTEAIRLQKHGIVLVFSYYNGADDTNYDWQSFYVPKTLVTLSTSGHGFNLISRNFSAIAHKYLYISDTSIKGHASNNATGTTNGITYANNKFVLRYVFGV